MCILLAVRRRPSDDTSRHLVGERDGGNLARPSCQQCREPRNRNCTNGQYAKSKNNGAAFGAGLIDGRAKTAQGCANTMHSRNRTESLPAQRNSANDCSLCHRLMCRKIATKIGSRLLAAREPCAAVALSAYVSARKMPLQSCKRVKQRNRSRVAVPSHFPDPVITTGATITPVPGTTQAS